MAPGRARGRLDGRTFEACLAVSYASLPYMGRWQWFTVLGLCALALGTLPAARGEPGPPPVVDLHVDLPYQITAKGRSAAEGSGNYPAKWLTAAGVAGVVLPLYVPKEVNADGPHMADLERVFRDANAALAAQPPWVVSRTGSPCASLAAKDGVAAFFSFEGLTPLGLDPSSVESWVDRGVRLFGLVHSYDSPVASSSGYRFHESAYGLSRRGKELVRRIVAFGGLVDVSHASDEATADVLALAQAGGATVVASHSNARALANHARNLTDAQIRAIAGTGGVVGIAFHTPFLTEAVRASLDDVVRHILHVRKVAGIEAVALGSDFEGGIRPPAELADVRGFSLLARALRRAGLSETELRQVFGGNAERVLCKSSVRR